MERNVEFLIECMDDLSMEQQKVSFILFLFIQLLCIYFFRPINIKPPSFQFQFYYRNLSRQQAQQQAWLQKRR